jgi:dolichol-phosphate mannosyltransferase
LNAAQSLISIVAPVYGCTDCLETLVDAVRDAFHDTALTWELILVDDRGPDDPWSVITELSRLDPRVRGVQLTHNHGQHLAIWAGLAQTQGSWVAVIDCDLQDDPQILPALHARALAEKVEAVVVERGTWSDSGWRRLASRVFHRVVQTLAGLNMDSNTGNFGLYSRRMVDILLSFEDKEVFLPAMVALTGLSRVNHPLDRADRAAGNSSYNMMRLIRIAVAIIIRFSDRPLKLSVVVGLAFSLISAMISVIVLIAWSLGSFSVPGWTSTILSMWFLSGLILAVLGVHGFYVGRIFSEVQRRPRILIEKTTTPAPP